MKVLFMISSFPKLSETFILNQITGFIDRGIDVEILAWNRADNKKVHPQVSKYNLIEKTHYLDFPKSRVRRLIGGAGLFFKLARRHPTDVFNAFNYKKYGKMVFTMRFMYALPYFLEKRRHDAIICHYGPNGSIATFFKDRSLLPEKLFVFFHGHDITSFIESSGDNIYNALLSSDSILMPVSELFADELLKIGANPSQIRVHHMGIDLNEYSLLPLNPIKGVMKFLSIGRLTEKKGMDIAIKTISELKKRGLRVSLDIIGEGELRDELKKIIKSEQLDDEVRLLGWQSQDEITRAIETANVVLQLSKTAMNGDKEGIPVVLMEAMGRGKLIVSTKHSGIPELIQDGVNGWLVPEKDFEEAANKIVYIKDNPEKWSAISLSARATIKESFNILQLNDQLVSYCASQDK